MLSITEFPKSILPAVRDNFENGRNQYVASADPFVMTVDSTLPIENYVFTGNHDGPKEFKGEVRYHKLKEYSYNLRNIEYFSALEIEYELLKYEQTGRIAQKASNFGFEWNRGIDKMAFEAINAGASTNGYDGTPFFGASHVDLDSGVQSNVFTGSSTLDETTLRIHQAAFANWKDDRGEVSGRKMTHILVKTGSVNHIQAKKLANSQYTVNGTNFAMNPFAASFEIIDSPYLGDSIQFVGLDLSGMNKPIIRQLSGEMIFNAAERESEVFLDRKVYRYSVFQDWAHGYNDWRLATIQL